jgi:hypothetical protein
MTAQRAVQRTGTPRPRVALPGADPRLPDLALLDSDRLTARLNRPARVRYLEYRPGHRLLALVQLLDRDPAGPGAELLLEVDPDGATVHADDPWLPARADAVADLRTALVTAGLPDPGPRCPDARLGYLPGRQVTRRLGDLVLKSYADPAAHRTAWAALVAVHESAGLPVAVPVTDLGPRLGAVQRFVAGRPVDGAAAVQVAERAGRVLRRWQRTAVRLTGRHDPAAQLRLAERAVTVVRSALPEQGRRGQELLDRLRRTAPTGLDLVPAHGDYTCGQLIDLAGAGAPDGTGLVVVDVDTAALAPAATDPAAYAANLTSGRVGDAARTAEALDRLLTGLGHRPEALGWHLAVALLRRADRPLRRFKNDWPDRTVRLLDGVQDAVTLAGHQPG